MRKFNISILIFSLFILSTNIFGETLDDCEKSNFTKCALGIKWGTEFEKPEILCPSIDKVEDWSNLD
jgi:hypothetical protein